MTSLLSYLFQKKRLVYLITIILLVTGFLTAFQLQKEAFPKIEFGVITITSTYRGASSEEVESLVSSRIESALTTIEGIEELESLSTDGQSFITVKLEPGIDSDRIRDDIQRQLDQLQTLPRDVDTPVITNIHSTTFPVVNITLSGGADYGILRQAALNLKDTLETIPGVAEIRTKGLLDPEIHVLINPDRLHAYYISLDTVIQSIQSKNRSLPGGTIDTGTRIQLLRTTPTLKSTKDVQNVVIQANDMAQFTSIKQLANVVDTFEERRLLYRTNGIETITLTVIKKNKADILKLIQKVRQEVESKRSTLQLQTINLNYENDVSKYISRRLNILSNNAILGFLILLTTLIFLLNKRISVYVVMGIPFSFLTAFLLMDFYGISLNLISLLGFILVIGMVVDNAIVVGEHIVHKSEKGKDPQTACIEGTRDMMKPILGTTLTTFAAFSALLFMGGIFGKFIKDIPIIVMITLVVSLIYAILILPVGMYSKLDKMAKKKQTLPKVEKWYKTLIKRYEVGLKTILKHPYACILSCILVLFLSLGIATKFMPFVLFPNEDAERFTINFEAPISTSLEQNAAALQKLERHIQDLPGQDLDFFTSTIGSQEGGQDSLTKGSHYAQITVFLKPENKRKRTARELSDILRSKFTSTPHIYTNIRFSIRQGGPPVGKAVNIYLSGPSYELLEQSSEKVQAYLGKIPGVNDIDHNFKTGKAELQVQPWEKTAAVHRVPLDNIGSAVRTAFSGTIATTLRKNNNDTPVRVILDAPYRKNTAYLRDLLIPNSRGSLIKLRYLAQLKEVPGYASLYHFDKQKTITVSADVDRTKTTVTEVNAQLYTYLQTLEKETPGLLTQQRGENKDTFDSIKNLGKAFLISLVFIYIIIVGLFNRFLDPLIIMLPIPFGIIGVIVSFFIHQEPISFMMMMGTIGMTGVVVNNSIILVHVIHTLKNAGESTYKAVINGAKQRFRAVLLTSITTLLALFPTAYGFGGNDPFVEPMCLALSWGIFFATLLTLFLLPCLYIILDDLRTRILQKIR